MRRLIDAGEYIIDGASPNTALEAAVVDMIDNELEAKIVRDALAFEGGTK